MTEKEIPWETRTSESWWHEVNSWPWTGTITGAWTKEGICPRCGHGMNDSFGGRINDPRLLPRQDLAEQLALKERLQPAGPMAQADNIDKDDLLVTRCNCLGHHPNRPPGIKTGCGSAGYFIKPTLLKED